MGDFAETVLQPQLIVTMLAAIAAFATVLSIVMPLLARDQFAQRMRVMATERDKMRAARLADLVAKDGQAKLRRPTSGYMQQLVDRFDLKARFDSADLRNRLKMAGLRGEPPVVAYTFFRVVMPILAALVALFYLFVVMKAFPVPAAAKIAIALVFGLFGYYLPNLFLQNMITRRQHSITNAFPDALDMLLICVQSGMSVEAAFAKVGKEIGAQSIELAEEFSLTTAELSYLQERRQAYENLGKRTGLAPIRAIGTALIQAERYGTPVGQALRVMAKENREMRMSLAEKKAAALPPKLTVPMIVFFLPVLFIVILGPATIQVLKWQ